MTKMRQERVQWTHCKSLASCLSLYIKHTLHRPPIFVGSKGTVRAGINLKVYVTSRLKEEKSPQYSCSVL
jgi:hypothetical protein